MVERVGFPVRKECVEIVHIHARSGASHILIVFPKEVTANLQG
jgi:hypothetical protein